MTFHLSFLFEISSTCFVLRSYILNGSPQLIYLDLSLSLSLFIEKFIQMNDLVYYRYCNMHYLKHYTFHQLMKHLVYLCTLNIWFLKNIRVIIWAEQSIHIYVNKLGRTLFCFIIMQIGLKRLRTCFLHGLWVLLFTFWKVWAQTCNYFIISKNKLDANICLSGFS